MRTVPVPSASAARERSGVAYAVSAYGLWGLFPLYFLLLLPTGPFEIVAYRVLFSFVFCLIVISMLRRWDKILAIVRQPRLFVTLGVAGMLIFINWQVYLVAVLAGQVTDRTRRSADIRKRQDEGTLHAI